MNLYLISQNRTDEPETYNSAIVAANNEDEARYTHPSTTAKWRWHAETNQWEMLTQSGNWRGPSFAWCLPKEVLVTHIGIAVDGIAPGVIISSYNAASLSV